MSRRLALGLVALAGCAPDGVEVQVPHPALGWLLPGRELHGAISVREAGGKLLAESSLRLADGVGKATLPELPAGRDLTVVVRWRIDQTEVAVSAARKIRLEPGKTAEVGFSARAYTYPDDDGDGALNLHEAAFGAAGAVRDATAAPPGYFDGLVAGLSAPDPIFRAAFEQRAVVGTVHAAAVGGPYTHQIHAFDPSVRHRATATLTCDEPVSRIAARPGEDRAVVVCGDRLHTFDLARLATDPAPEASTQLPYTVPEVAYGRSGLQLFAAQTLQRSVYVLSSLTLDLFDIVDVGDVDADSVPAAVVDTGAHLVVADYGTSGLIVFSHVGGQDFAFAAEVARGELPAPRQVLYDPSSERLYVTSEGDGLLRVIDAGADHPSRWRVLGSVDVGEARLALEPVQGAWLYGVTADRILRVDALTLSVTTMALGLVGQDNFALSDIAVATDGTRAIAGALDGSLFLLGNVEPRRAEREPNQALADLDGLHNVVGAPPSIAVGFVDRQETGALRLLDRPDFDIDEDLEDLWQLDLGGDTSGRLAVALVTTSPYKRQSLALLGPNGAVLAQAVGSRPDVIFPLGTGVIVLSPPLASLPAGSLLGVDGRDNDTVENASGYELIVTRVPASLLDVGEQEPANDAWPDPPILSTAPATLQGTVSPTDDDCFRLQASFRRLGLLVEMASEVDVNLWVNGVPLQTAFVGDGDPEYLILEAQRCAQPAGQPDTVASCTAAGTVFPFCIRHWASPGDAPAPYSLTILDFTVP